MAAHELPLTRSQLRRVLDDGDVSINGQPAAKPGQKLKAGDVVVVTVRPPKPVETLPQNIPLTVLYEDSDLIVINKPAGLVVHPAPGHPDSTLVNALLAHCTDLSGVGGELRPGIVHRLDRDTSGVMVATKNDAAHTVLAQMFKAKDLVREYRAIVAPPPKQDVLRIDTLHGRHPVDRKRFTGKVKVGKRAVTNVRIEERLDSGVAVVVCRLETGRTHQIRVHLAEAGFAIVGDQVYGHRPRSALIGDVAEELGRQALHAERLEFVHPRTGAALAFTTPLPADMAHALTRLRQGR